MAQRSKRNAKPSSAKAGATAAARKADGQLQTLKRERDAFEAELALAHARIAELESQRTQAVDRIDRALAFLGGLLTVNA